ncbi:syndecan-3 [Tachysurus ichikawai]
MDVKGGGQKVAADISWLWPERATTQRHSLRPVDQEGSGNDLYDDEDYFSGSGSGYPVMEIDLTEPSASTPAKESLPVSTTQASGPAPSAPPAAEPSSTPAPEVDRESGMDNERELEIEMEKKREQQTEHEQEMERTPSPNEDIVTTEEEDDDIVTTEVAPITISSTTARPITTPSTPSTAPPRSRKPHPVPSISPKRPRKPQATASPATPTESTRPVPTSTVQVKTPETDINNEVAVAGPSGDSEIREEDGRRGNELGHGKGASDVGAEPDLTGNTIDTGSSAAQLPQKNILERKEVLIAVIVGGVVGALFAAFLVMLLVYRMKKKDEGSYTLEEPKQATVTYQKPDKQEEFYA